MNCSRFSTVCSLSVALVVIGGCTGENPGTSADAGSALNVSVLTRGVVSTDNGLSVGGEALPLQSAAVTVNGDVVPAGMLRDGMWVTIERENGAIRSVRYEEDIKGPIDNVNLDGSLSILGQEVLVSSSTRFEDSNAGSLASGDVVEVSGLRDSNDRLTAGWIELKQDNADTWSVTGKVRNIDRSRQVLAIGNLTVDYSQASFDDMNESTLVDGLEIEVKNTTLDYEPGSFFLKATRIERSDDQVSSSSSFTVSGSSRPGSSGSDSGSDREQSDDRKNEVRIEGIVTRIDANAGTLEVAGFLIVTARSTQFRGYNDQAVSREEFFSRLRQGVTVVKVKWKPFSGYDLPPHELELET